MVLTGKFRRFHTQVRAGEQVSPFLCAEAIQAATACPSQERLSSIFPGRTGLGKVESGHDLFF